MLQHLTLQSEELIESEVQTDSSSDSDSDNSDAFLGTSIGYVGFIFDFEALISKFSYFSSAIKSIYLYFSVNEK